MQFKFSIKHPWYFIQKAVNGVSVSITRALKMQIVLCRTHDPKGKNLTLGLLGRAELVCRILKYTEKSLRC